MSGRRQQTSGFARGERVAEQIRRDLVDLLRQIKDPRVAQMLPLVTVTDIEVTADYSHAKVFYTVLVEEPQRAAVARGLKNAAGFLRRELGRRLHIHNIPELHFVYDVSVERGTRLSRLIDEAVQSDASDQHSE